MRGYEVVVEIPPQLRHLVEGRATIACNGSTVAEVLTDIERRYYDLAERIESARVFLKGDDELAMTPYARVSQGSRITLEV